jgi:hypothetical protein
MVNEVAVKLSGTGMETPFKNPESVSVAEEIVAGRPVKSPISCTGWAWPLKVRVMESAAIERLTAPVSWLLAVEKPPRVSWRKKL